MSSPSDFLVCRATLFSFLIFGVAACGGGKTDVSASPPTAGDIAVPNYGDLPVPPSGVTGHPMTLGDRIKQIEDEGKIPKLDRTETMAGVDSDNDGVRDDIQAFIAIMPLAAEQKRAAMQEARALQGTLFVDLTDKIALQKSGDRTMAAVNCTGDKIPKDHVVVGEKLQAMTVNTKLRMRRYMQYNAARSGSATTMPNGDSCE